jgi:peptidoglycan/xylan/chitin deacetylase (PgdA/CDA1 family)
MNAAKHLSLQIYSRLSQPFRARRLARLQRRGKVPVCVLFYHRVADWSPSPWTTPVEVFRRQVEWLQAKFDIVSLGEAQRRVAAGTNDKPTACITFDDGYADNFDFALPLLLRDRIPFTYFVSSEIVLRGQPFPHDSRAGLMLRTNKPAEIKQLADAGVEIGCHTRTHADLGYAAGENVLEQEIVEAKYDLEDMTGREIRYFAFPYGMPDNMSQEAFRVAFHAGYAGVCSAYGAYNRPGGDPFHIRRIHADPEFARFVNWMTLDRRKLKKREKFDPGNYRQSAAATTEDTGERRGEKRLVPVR